MKEKQPRLKNKIEKNIKSNSGKRKIEIGEISFWALLRWNLCGLGEELKSSTAVLPSSHCIGGWCLWT